LVRSQEGPLLMKKNLLIIFFSIILFSLQGQSFKGGVRLGFSSSQISGDELAGFNKFGAYTGIFTNFPISKNMQWKIQAELNFIMKGSSMFLRANADNEVPNQYILTMLYTETPFLVKYSPKPWVELELGPAINFLFYSHEKDSNGKIPARQRFRIFELAGIGGISFIVKENFGINLRYSNSLLPVRVPDGNHSQYRMRYKQFNSVLTCSLFYQF
jgi:hypothetical protein